MASAAAQTYFNSFPPAKQESIRASWGGADRMDEWFNNAVGAGAVQSNGQPRDPNAGAGSQLAQQTGATQGQSAGVSGSSGLKPGQTPTPAQLRQFAKENNWSEDFDRFNDATLASWIGSNWNPQTMKFTSEKKDQNGNPIPGDVEKPVDTPDGWTAWGQGAIRTSDAQNKMAGWGGGGAGNNGGMGGQAPPPPPQPVTNGNQLSMTGNPLQDMLIGQFNTGQNPSTYQNNIFALGEDMKPGGTGANADAQQSGRQAQSLSGGGLWWGQNADTFGGFDASQKNATGTESISPAAPKPAAAQPVAQQNTAPVQKNGPSQIGGAYNANRNTQAQTPVSGMLGSSFSNPARNKPSYF
jgi:hypothetical protein